MSGSVFKILILSLLIKYFRYVNIYIYCFISLVTFYVEVVVSPVHLFTRREGSTWILFRLERFYALNRQIAKLYFNSVFIHVYSTLAELRV